MTAVRAVWVECDPCREEVAVLPREELTDDRGRGIDTMQYPPDLGSPTAENARFRAGRVGWHFMYGRDICPDCWKEGRR